MAEQKYLFKMEMTCDGCANAAKRVLGKLPEVKSVETSLEAQTVTVVSTLPSDVLLENLKKTGKECSFVGLA